MAEIATAVRIQHVRHHYGPHRALNDVSLSVPAGQVFALLGPNGSGKTTLFRLINTLASLQDGEIEVFGCSVSSDRHAVRSQLGIVFQSASLDPKLTVFENIRCQAALYGLSGPSMRSRIEEVSGQLGIRDRADTKTEELSGGLKRRVELAKGILHRPKLLLMDEPSTGLDPAARLDMWHALKDLQQNSGVTILLTTHLLEEADKADRIAIVHAGQVVADGHPGDLRSSLGGRVLSIQTAQPAAVLEWCRQRSLSSQQTEDLIRVVGDSVDQVVAPLTQALGDQIQTLTLGQPSLEDVFIARTGHQFWNTEHQPGDLK